MKKSTIIITIIIFVSIVGGGLLGFYFYLNSSTSDRNQFGELNTNTGSGFGSPSINTSITFPGNASTTQPEQEPELVASEETITNTDIPLLRKIYEFPTAGFSFFSEDIIATSSAITESVVVANGRNTATSTRTIRPAQSRVIGKKEVLHFIDRGNGHIFKTASTTLSNEKISNFTVPKIYEAYFINENNFVFRGLYQNTDIIHTRFATLRASSPTSTEKIIDIKDLAPNLAQLALSPTKRRSFYIQNNQPTGIITNPDGTGIVNVFSSPFTEWNIAWPNENTIALNTRPSAFVPGFLYTLNPTTRVIQKVIGDIAGLTSLFSPDANQLVFTQTEAGAPNLFAYDRRTSRTLNLFLRTFTEKCTWSKREVDIMYCAVPQDIAFGDYPDVWYQGLIFFTDDIWRVNVRTGETRLIARLNELSSESIDVTNPTLNPTEDYLVFNNKRDLSLWGLKLPNRFSTTTSTSTTRNSSL